MNWKTFDSAPKDGSEVLAYRPDAGVFVVTFQPQCYFVQDGDDDPIWWTTLGEDISGNLPTHWQPLPEPPKD